MRTTIDKAGRLVVPKQLRDHLGLQPGAVEVVVDGAGLRVEAVAEGEVVEENGRSVIVGVGMTLGDDAVRALRDADQR